ncbi:hypothetical protein [Serratia marcescens]|uniref:hypothetical protein n=1 Tax=Serratia marcescens TaxID=615 RepID=UPI000669219B|nr:hypothetical protein [Serratia marcescens]MBH2979470.1 hypothetical protein [Serratia marcescens]MDU0859332.1 hypothetical protein [Serratia marcescens]POX19371.1 hypothetical protein C3468_15465 [Serratia marcescens]HAX9713550.1 hypothetical protein [Serratia marcescens]HEJ7902477.1 hypothetical protein [Serratia marcescens]
MTLTTERLKQLADPNMICKCGWDEYKSMATELLANREAQPVGYIAEVSGNRVGVLRGLPMPDVGSLIYTATPAPAVINGRTAEGWMAEALLQKKVAEDLRKSAPEVPEKMISVVKDEVEYANGWNACRAAMLAAAPEGDK